MIALPPQIRVFLYRRPTAMRKSFHGLVALTEAELLPQNARDTAI